MTSSSSARTARSLVIGLFEREPQARQAVQAVCDQGVTRDQVSLLTPGERPGSEPSGLLPLALAAADQHDLSAALGTLGLPDGEARFYAHEASDGRTLVIIDADGQFDAIRELVLQYGGYDVRSRGRDLARPEGAGVAGGTGPRPVDVTGNWQDVRSRYEMLWQQHYGTTDATWDQVEPIYSYAWQAANESRNRGRPWSEVEATLREHWQSNAPLAISWSEAAGPVRDVWEDVAEEATQGAEGGADRRVARQGTDQSIAARDVQNAP
jgi:hypothetical protein